MLRFSLPDTATPGESRSRLHLRPRRGRPTRHTQIQAPVEAALGQLFVHSRDAVVVGDIDSGHIVLSNPAAQTLFGFTSAETVGRPMVMLLTPDAARLNQARLAHYARSADPAILTSASPLEVQALNSSRDEMRVTLSLAPLDVAGHPARFVLLMFRDATAQQRAGLHALELARAESRIAGLQATLAQRDALLNETTREVGAALARTRRSSTRLARLAHHEPAISRRLALMARVLERRTEAAQRTLDQFDQTAAIQSATFEMDSQRVNLVPLVGRRVAAARTRSAAYRLNLGAPQGLTTQGDPRCLGELVDDLIERAMRRNPRGCWIDVDLRRPLAGIARIEVRDYGRPPSDTERDGLMHAARADRSWQLNRFVVERHGGTLSVEFPSEGGVRAIVVLPTNRGRVHAEP